MPRIYYSWHQFDEDAREIAEWAKRYNFKSVFGIPRGGLVVAVKMSHLLKIPLLLSRDDITNDTLVVDDIIDTGKTMHKLLFSLLGANVMVASLFVGPEFGDEERKVAPDFFLHRKTDKDTWVVFPWEDEDDSEYDGTFK